MGDVVSLPNHVHTALEKAKSWGMKDCIIIGLGSDKELHCGGSTSDIPLILYLIEMFKTQLLNAAAGDEEMNFVIPDNLIN